MPPPAAGSNKIRANVNGHLILATLDEVRHLRRLSSEAIGHLFDHAKEYGQVHLTLDERAYTIMRQSDHTFLLQHGQTHHGFI